MTTRTGRLRAQPTPPRILDIRDARVVLDEELARLYRVSTSRLNQAVRRNANRFPQDFAFQLTNDERRILISQSVISSGGHGGARKRPLVFTEHGALMAATVLRSNRAVEMSIFIVRTFVRMRDAALAHEKLAVKLKELEQRVTNHDDELKEVVHALRKLIIPSTKNRRQIGFSARATGDNLR